MCIGGGGGVCKLCQLTHSNFKVQELFKNDDDQRTVCRWENVEEKKRSEKRQLDGDHCEFANSLKPIDLNGKQENNVVREKERES